MTSVLKSDWLRDVLLERLRKADSFPTDLATKNARPLQITEFMQYRELGDKNKHVTGKISDRYTVITCQFSAECCNEWEASQEGRRFTELKGALVMADKWEMNVLQLPSKKFKAVVKIDSIRYIGSEGEPMIGDPRDFNTWNSVLETLRSTSRQSIFLHLPKDEEGYSSQQDTSRFETQALPPQASKRRKLNTEESVAWKEVKSISYKDYQITAGDQGSLDSETTWVHPGNIHDYNKRPEDEEPLPAADTSLIENGHPPLDSPEPEPLSQRHDDSQFHTQAPRMLDPTQALGVQTSSEEKEIEWEPTQEEDGSARRSTVEEKSEEPLEWEASPARPPRVGRMDGPPALDSDDEASPLVRNPPQPPIEEEAPSSPASQPPMEDEEHEQETTEILFAEDITKETPVEEDELSMDKELSASMKVSTAELLTQEPIVETQKIIEIVKVTETIVEETADEEDDPMEETVEPEVEPEPEQMQEVEESEKVTIREESEVVVETVTESQDTSSDQQIVQPSAQPVISTTQDDSSSTKYPASTPSDQHLQTPSQITTTQNESQEPPPSHNQMHPPSSPKPPPPTFLPPHQSSPVQTSPPKATPVLPVPASAQIQVKETPFPAHRPAQQQIVYTSSTTHISATAPSPVKEATPVRRKHKRDEYEGPVVPKFSRREKEIKVDLEAIIRDDLKRFVARLKDRGELRQREKEKEKAEGKDEKEEVMEEVVEESFEVEEKVETTVEPEQMEEVVQESSEIEEKMDETIELDYEEELVQEEIVQEREVVQEEEVQQSVQVEEKMDEAIEPDREEEVIQEGEVEGKKDTTIEPNHPEQVEVEIQKEVVELEISEPRNDIPTPSPAPDTNTQDDSQTADVEETRWGRFANHWRRFTRFTT